MSWPWKSEDGSAGTAGRFSEVLLPALSSACFIEHLCVSAGVFFSLGRHKIAAASCSLALQGSYQAVEGLWWVFVWIMQDW